MTELTKPSWLRWPPNCCEACIGWQQDKDNKHMGICQKSDSLNQGIKTDSRDRCPSLVRKAGI